MKVMLVVVVTITTLLILAPASAWAVNTVTFDVEKATIRTYATFMRSLRNKAQDPKRKCYSIPMLPEPDTNLNPKNYLLVKLQGASEKNITLMLRRTNLNVVGYSDSYDSECRYHIFRDIPLRERTYTKNTLCPSTSPRHASHIRYNSGYPTLEKKANVSSRSQVQLGIQILSSDIGKISGQIFFTEETEAKFLLVAIQMVSEAARFNYIENQVWLNFNRNFFPNTKVINLEDNWDTISREICHAKEGTFRPPLYLKYANGAWWIVHKVDEIKRDMGLLTYIKGVRPPNYQNAIFPQLIMSTDHNYMANLGDDQFEGF